MNDLRTDDLSGDTRMSFFLVVALIVYMMPAVCYSQVEPLVVPLIAGQHINVGTVSVTNTDTEILVTYQTTGDWLIQETHLDMELDYSGLDTTKKGNPIPGKFTYKTTHSNPVMEVSFTIENFGWTVDSLLFLAAHSVVVSSQGSETAWGDGLNFPGRNWATYFNYTVQAEQQPNSGVLQFSNAVYEVTEPGRIIRRVDVLVTVIRTDGAAGTISADYTVSPGTASKDLDYLIVNETGTLTFAEDEMEKSILITILDDSRVEDEFETIDLKLEATCCLGQINTAQIKIQDDDVLH